MATVRPDDPVRSAIRYGPTKAAQLLERTIWQCPLMRSFAQYTGPR